jgi:periplasmic iron binding protein
MKNKEMVMKRPMLATVISVTSAVVLAVGPIAAKEYPIGKPKTLNGMEVAAVYLQPIEMDPPGMMRAAVESDIRLEADIHAAKANSNGFPDGAWMPYLVVRYDLTKPDTGQTLKGELMPMVANDGPHYGENLKLMGVGKYKLTLTILPPSENEHVHFGRHVDKETGVASWFKPFTVDFDFVFAGTGKKGSY